jgi:hypothetical protein
MKCLFLDCETSGLPDYAGREILQWAFMGWDDGVRSGVQVDRFRMLGDPTNEHAAAALRINGYDYAKREEYPVMQAGFIKRLYDAVTECDGYVVGCNPSFDWDAFVLPTGDRLGVPRPAGRVRLIDVSSMALPLVVAGKIESIALRKLAMLVGRPQQEPHDAGADVVLACDVFEKLFELYYKALV